MNHTPGPWWVEPEEASDRRGLAICAEDAVIATITPDEGGPFPLDNLDRANARLMAAAPDLLAACEQATAFIWNELNENPDKKDMDGSIMDRLINLQTDILATIAKTKEGKVNGLQMPK